MIAEAAAGTCIVLSGLAGFAVLGFATELHQRLDDLHTEGRLKQAPYRLARWLRLNPLAMIQTLGLPTAELPEGRTVSLVRRAKLLILVHVFGAVLGLMIFFAFVAYPAISRAS